MNKGYSIPWLVVHDGERFYLKDALTNLTPNPRGTETAYYWRTDDGWRVDYRSVLHFQADVFSQLRSGNSRFADWAQQHTLADFIREDMSWHHCEGLTEVHLWNTKMDLEVSYEQFLSLCDEMAV